MSGRAQARFLHDRRRLHLQDGPIDLVIEVFGPEEVVAEAYRAAVVAFDGLLDALCAELPLIRAQAMPHASPTQDTAILISPKLGMSGLRPSGEKVPEGRSKPRATACGAGWGGERRGMRGMRTAPSPLIGRCAPPSPRRGEGPNLAGEEMCGPNEPCGPVARRMARAVAPFAAETFITPMAAVAGAVADHVLAAMVRDPRIARAYVNNGGDIALHVAPGKRLRVGLIGRPDRPSLLGQVVVDGGDGIGGIATSGWRGRSFSLGIADAVTVLARSAAEADAAATIIANAVDLPGHPAVVRAPADSLQPDSDLGSRLVTRDVGPLTEAEIAQALAAGLACADELLARGLILGAALQVQGRIATTAGHLPTPLWRGVGGEGFSGRALPVPCGREPHAQRPSPPAPLHKGEGSERRHRARAAGAAMIKTAAPESLHA